MSNQIKSDSNSSGNRLLETMLGDLSSAPAQYRPTNFWSSVLNQVTDVIKQYGIESFRDESAITCFVPHYTDQENSILFQPSKITEYSLLRIPTPDRISGISAKARKVIQPSIMSLTGKITAAPC